MSLNFEDWSAREATTYFEWFVSQIDDRLSELNRFVEGVRRDCTLDLKPRSLGCLGEFFVDEISTRPSTPQETMEDWLALPAHVRPLVNVEPWQLSEATRSLCVDVGVYFAEVLRRRHLSLTWVLWRRKTVEYNRPVLTGFKQDVPLDPVLIATNVAYHTARETGEPTRLRELFDHWSQRVAQ